MATQEGLFIVGDSHGTATRGGWPYCMADNPTLKNLAVGSTTLVGNMEPNYDTNCAATSVTDYPIAIIQGGVNDAAADETLANMQAAITSMAGTANSYGFDLYICGIAPWKNDPAWSAARQTKTDDFNAWLAAQEVALGYTYIDVYTPLEDDITADALEADYDVGDGIHCNNAGYKVWGATVTSAIPSLTRIAPETHMIYKWRGAVQPAETSPSGNEIKLWRGAIEPAAVTASADALIGGVTRSVTRTLTRGVTEKWDWGA